MTTEYIPGVGEESPWVDLWEKVWKEQGGKGELTNYRVYGMSRAYLFASALRAAGKDLTRERIVDVIEQDAKNWPGPNHGALPLLGRQPPGHLRHADGQDQGAEDDRPHRRARHRPR
ncbi:hypothetical protein LP422_06930 [Janibacter limosus]|uniref:Uncharacterized protein n=1 Tax=Janibacter limosus TaxID=53458 RepID=A0AC61U6R5_9MICO|nr:hypothetical protein [Janibacter limosus]UUZ45721.1 hypothetical protein LP422_06930 [Janibacter limosus]